MKRVNNDGFSLIELIIVIAMMAVMVAVIAPNLTKYLGKSKKDTDVKNLDEVHNAVMIAVADAVSSEPAVDVMTSPGTSTNAVYIFKYDAATAKTVFDSSDSRNLNASAGFAKLVTDQIGSSNISSHTSGKNKIMVTITVNSSGVYDVSQSFTN